MESKSVSEIRIIYYIRVLRIIFLSLTFFLFFQVVILTMFMNVIRKVEPVNMAIATPVQIAVLWNVQDVIIIPTASALQGSHKDNIVEGKSVSEIRIIFILAPLLCIVLYH